MATSASVEQLVGMTGIASSEAEQLLEVTGGDISMAIEIVFGGGAAPVQEEQVPLAGVLWASGTITVPESWAMQGFQVGTNGFIQHRNGPCGVLAAVQAMCLAAKYDAGTVKEDSDDELQCSREDLVRAFDRLLRAASSGGPIKLCRWTGSEVGMAHDTEEVQAEVLESKLEGMIEAFTGPGGVLLLLYSLVLTRGQDTVRRDVTSYGSELPLITGPHSLCTFDLMSLLLRGTAQGCIGAFDQLQPDKARDWDPTSVGLLSFGFEDANHMPVCNALASPKHPIWVLHGTDHFTVLYKKENTATNRFRAYHYNGLPPAGPRRAVLDIEAPRGRRPSPKEKHTETFYKPIDGSINSIVQAADADKKAFPNQIERWSFEVTLHFTDPENPVEGAERPADMPLPPTFTCCDANRPASDAAWRCLRCYETRFKTMCFGLNQGTPTCQHCGQHQDDCNWSLWIPYDTLPESWQHVAQKRYGPSIVNVLRTKWPACSVSFVDKTSPSSA